MVNLNMVSFIQITTQISEYEKENKQWLEEGFKKQDLFKSYIDWVFSRFHKYEFFDKNLIK